MAVASQARSFEPSLSKPIVTVSPWIVLIVLALGEYMILLDATVVNVAIPNMIKDLHASLDQVLWVLNAYVLTFAVLLITAGRLGGMFGPKKLFLGGMILFTAASVACSLAQTPNQLIFFRVLQAVGGAALTPQTLSIITSIFPPEKRGQAFGIWGVVYGLGGATGPTLGGLLTSSFSWRAIFLPNLPIGVVATILAFLIMPELTVHRRHRLDIVGVFLASAGLFALVFGLVEGQRYNWGRITNTGAFDLGSVHGSVFSIPTIFLASAIFLLLFPIWESRLDEPLLPLSLFRDRNFSLGCTVSAIQVFGMIGLYLPLTLFLQTILHLTPLQAGVAILPQALASMAVAPGIGKLSDRVNGKYLLTVGLILYSAGVGWIIWLASNKATGLTFTPPLIVLGIGVGMCAAPVVSLTMQSIVPSASGAASGFMNTIRQVGGAIAAALSGAILQSRVASGHSFLDAMKTALWVPLGLALAGALLTLAMRAPRRGQAPVSVHGPAEGLPVEGVARPAEERAPTSVPMPVFAAVHGSDTIIMPVSIPRRVEPVRPMRSMRPPFLVRVGDAGRTEHFIKNTLTIGRLPNNTVAIQDPEASRRHVEITRHEDEYVARDLGSANGTLVNNQRIAEPRPLHEGDTITIGNTAFVYHDDFEIARPRLIHMTGTTRSLYLIRKSLTLGRSPGNDVVVNDNRSSRHHAELSTHAGVVFVRDLNSLNGTRVNGELVAGDHLLQDGDVITIGDASYTYHNDFEAANPV